SRNCWREACSCNLDVFGEPEDLVPGPPEGGASPDIVRPREMELACVEFGGAVENSVLEGLVGLLAVGACRGRLPVFPGGVRGQVAFSRPHLVEAACCEPVQAHEGVGPQAGFVGVGGVGGAEETPMT